MTFERENIADILCIGSQKASTSWLHSVLNHHPDSWAFPDSEPVTSSCKEAHFWDWNHNRGAEWYRDLLAPPDPTLKTLDFTPEYAFLGKDQIAECKKLNPTAKVIYVLRDPMVRALSALRMHALWEYGAGKEFRLQLDDKLLELMRKARLDAHGSFARNFDAWSRHYPDILVLNYEKLHANREMAIKQVLDFVGLDPARLTGDHKERFDAVMDKKVWESEKYPVDRDVLLYLHGFTARTREATKRVFGFEFVEGPRMIAQAAVAPFHQDAPATRDDATQGGPTQGNDVLAALHQIRDETRKSREVAETANARLLNQLKGELQEHRNLTRILLNTQVADMFNDIDATLKPLQYQMTETLELVREKRLSLSRFGDGELMLMASPDHNLRFQQNSPELREMLRAALDPNWKAPGRVLVSLPPTFRGNLHWVGAWKQMWPMLKSLLDPSVRYGHSLVSRSMFFSVEGQRGVDLWRRIWDDRDVLVVTGKGSRFDLLPELFDCARQIDFLHTKARHAFSDHQQILQQVVERAGSETLVLLSLGPTASILPHLLAAQGIQALDIGHLSSSYTHVFNDGVLPEQTSDTR